MTPWLGWTWDSLAQSSRIRHFCWTQCRCAFATATPEKRPLSLFLYWLSRTHILNIDLVNAEKILESAPKADSSIYETQHWRFIGNTYLGLIRNGALRLLFYKDGMAQSILLAERSGVIHPWPQHLLGPLDNPVDLTENPFVTPGLKDSRHGSRPVTCQSLQECSSDDAVDGPAVCVSASEDLQGYFGFDAVYPSLGLCLTLGSALLATGGLSQGALGPFLRRKGSLGGRSFEAELPSLESVAVNCFCNATFVAEACCYTETGIFDEDL